MPQLRLRPGDMGRFFFLHLFYGELKKEEAVMFQYKKRSTMQSCQISAYSEAVESNPYPPM
jgi:hypothetical protein